MSLNQILKAQLSSGLVMLAVAGLATVAGCSSSGSMNREGPAAETVSTADASSDPGPVDLTATEAAIARGDTGASSQAYESARDPGGIVNPSAPKSYTVKRGDTLWDISTMFLRDPWLWPEIWYVNNQIQNPHLIYPGDVLALAYGADGRPQIRLERGGPARLDPRLRSSPLDSAIPIIPYSTIAAFLSRPSLVSKDDVRKAPHVLAFRDGHMVGGTGHEIYVQNLKGAESSRYSVVHIGEALRDPDDGDVLGYQGIYTATAVVVKEGNPSKAVLSESERETLQGDRLFSVDNNQPLNFIPRAPAKDVNGRIISVIDGESLIGQYQIVAINRGTNHGVESGNVLAVDQAGEIVRDKYAKRGTSVSVGFGSSFAKKVKLPDERAGTLLVFKTYDRMSYALVVGASNSMRVADIVRNP